MTLLMPVNKHRETCSNIISYKNRNSQSEKFKKTLKFRGNYSFNPQFRQIVGGSVTAILKFVDRHSNQ